MPGFLKIGDEWSLPGIYNVKSFGAKGDGVTDDTNAINNAIAAVMGVGKRELYFPPGTYNDVGTLNNVSSVTFVGDGVTFTSGRYKTVSFSSFVLKDAANETINGSVTFNGNVTLASGQTFLNNGTISGGTVSGLTRLSTSKNTLDDGTGNATFAGTINLNGGATLASGQTFSNNGTISGGVVTGLTSLSTSKNVIDDGSGNATFAGTVSLNNGATLASGKTLTNNGTILGGIISGLTRLSTSKNTLDDGTGNATFTGTVSLNNGATLASGKTLTNNGTISGGVITGLTSLSTAKNVLDDGTGAASFSSYVTFARLVTFSSTVTLANGQVFSNNGVISGGIITGVSMLSTSQNVLDDGTGRATLNGLVTFNSRSTFNGGLTVPSGQTLINLGTISGGIVSDLSKLSTSVNTLDDGSGNATFAGTVSLNNGATLASGKTLTNNGTISGGTITPSTMFGTISGNPTWTGTHTFSGTINLNGGAILASGQTFSNNGTISGGTVSPTTVTGTIGGSPTWTGTHTFGGITLNGSLNFNQNQAVSFVFDKSSSQPLNPVVGQAWYDTTKNQLYVYKGSSLRWQIVGGGTADYYKFTATAGQTVINLPTGKSYLPGTNMMHLFISGVHQDPDTFSETSSTQVTVNTPFNGGEDVLLSWFTQPPSSQTIPTATNTTIGGVKGNTQITINADGTMNVQGTANNTLDDGSGNLSLKGKINKVGNVSTTGNFGVATVLANVSETQLTTTSATTIFSVTPPISGNYEVKLYIRVANAATNVTPSLTWTDASGSAQTNDYGYPSGSLQQPGGWSVFSAFVNATTAGSITLTVTAGTANNVYVSAVLIGM